MSQCHDIYQLPDHLETPTAHIDLQQDSTAIYATATLALEDHAVVGRGTASYEGGQDRVATRAAIAQALVALADALVDPSPSNVGRR